MKETALVFIPARNEGGNIGDLVRSLPPDSVIVVDDFSMDNTAEEARAAGAGVLPAPQLIAGAVGKSNSCMEGARVLTSRWILFADADTRFKLSFVESAVAAAEAGKIDFLSVYLRAEYRTLWESALAPYGVALVLVDVDVISGLDQFAVYNTGQVRAPRAAVIADKDVTA